MSGFNWTPKTENEFPTRPPTMEEAFGFSGSFETVRTDDREIPYGTRKLSVLLSVVL